MKDICLLILKDLPEGQTYLDSLWKRRCWHMPFSQSPSTLLAPVGIPHLLAHHGPTKAKICVVHMEDTPLMSRSSGQWRLHFWSHRSETIAETVFGRLPPPRHNTDNRQKHTLRLSVKGPVYLSWRFNLRGRLQVYTHVEAIDVLSGNEGWGMLSFYSLSTSLQLISIPKKGAHYTYLDPPFFFPTVIKGTSPNCN